MFRTPGVLSYRLLYAATVSSVCKNRIFQNGNDVMKLASGCLQIQRRDYTRAWHTYTRNNAVDCFLCLGHSPYSGVDVNSFNRPISVLSQQLICAANYSTSSDSKASKGTAEETAKSENTDPAAAAEVDEQKLTIFQRFKRAYKEHGIILVSVHVATSIVWYGSFYAAVRCGIDIVPYLEQLGFSERWIRPFRAGGLGDYAIAYLMYKLATPARYTVTLGGTNMVIRYRRNIGKMAPKSQEDSIRELYKEGRRKVDSNLRKDRIKRLREAREKKKAQKWKKGDHL